MASLIDTLPTHAGAMFSALIRVRRFMHEFLAEVQRALYALGHLVGLLTRRLTLKGQKLQASHGPTIRHHTSECGTGDVLKSFGGAAHAHFQPV